MRAFLIATLAVCVGVAVAFEGEDGYAFEVKHDFYGGGGGSEGGFGGGQGGGEGGTNKPGNRNSLWFNFSINFFIYFGFTGIGGGFGGGQGGGKSY